MKNTPTRFVNDFIGNGDDAMRRAELVNELFGLEVDSRPERFIAKVKKAVKKPIDLSEDLLEAFLETKDPDKERVAFCF